MDKIFYVYVLLDPRKPGTFKYGKYTFPYEPFYVGKGKGQRVHAHYLRANTWVKNKIKRIQTEGKVHRYCFLREAISESLAFRIEARAITLIGRKDLNQGPLCNLSAGGEGSTGAIHSKHTRLKRSNTLRSQWDTLTLADYTERCLNMKIACIGRSEEQKLEISKKISASTTARFAARSKAEKDEYSKRAKEYSFFCKVTKEQSKAMVKKRLQTIAGRPAAEQKKISKKHSKYKTGYWSGLNEEERHDIVKRGHATRKTNQPVRKYRAPNGKVYVVTTTLKEFCLKHEGIHTTALSGLWTGRLVEHKGWTKA